MNKCVHGIEEEDGRIWCKHLEAYCGIVPQEKCAYFKVNESDKNES